MILGHFTHFSCFPIGSKGKWLRNASGPSNKKGIHPQPPRTLPQPTTPTLPSPPCIASALGSSTWLSFAHHHTPVVRCSITQLVSSLVRGAFLLMYTFSSPLKLYQPSPGNHPSRSQHTPSTGPHPKHIVLSTPAILWFPVLSPTVLISTQRAQHGHPQTSYLTVPCTTCWSRPLLLSVLTQGLCSSML